jgi:hypothetical protein
MAVFIIIGIFIFSIGILLGLLDKVIAKIPGGKYFVGAVGLFVGLSIAVSTGAWHTFATYSGIGNPDAVLAKPDLPSIPDVPDVPKVSIPDVHVDIGKPNIQLPDGVLQLNPFNPGVISNVYLEPMNKIGTTIEIKPPDNQDTWKQVGGREKQFGAAWKDVDRNGCDTRNDILKRDILAYQPNSIEYKDGAKQCVVAKGTLFDPYTGLVKNFVRGEKTSADVQIDHVVALHLAWQEGAKYWTQEKREQLANDPDNLMAVDGKTNNVKSDGWCAPNGCDINANNIPDPEDKLYSFWMPPNRNYRCEYAKKEVEVHEKYGLWMVPEEAKTYKTTLAVCSGSDAVNGLFG